jgi:hypothetical protein
VEIDNGDRRFRRRWSCVLYAAGDEQPDCSEEQALQDAILCCEDHVSKTPTQTKDGCGAGHSQNGSVLPTLELRAEMSPSYGAS